MCDIEESSGSQEVAPVQKQSKDDFDLNKSFLTLSDDQKEQAVNRLLEMLLVKWPPKYPLFELFSVRVEFDHESEKRGELYGFIEAQDGGDAVYFLNSDDGIGSQSICNNEFVSLTGPNRCVSASGSLMLDMELYVKVKGEVEEELEVSYMLMSLNFNRPRYRDMYYQCRSQVSTGEHGRVTLYYAALLRAVQATVEATLEAPDGDLLDVYGRIVAYYGDFGYGVEPHEEELYRVTLLDRPKSKHAALKNGGIPLSRSVLAVPSSCSLVIKANFWDFDSKDEILSGTFTFPVQFQDSSNGHIESQRFRINFKVDWACKYST